MKYSLIGLDSNCFMILGYVQKAMRKEHYSKEEIDEYVRDAESDDYQHLLYVSQNMIDKLNQDSDGTEYDVSFNKQIGTGQLKLNM